MEIKEIVMNKSLNKFVEIYELISVPLANLGSIDNNNPF